MDELRAREKVIDDLLKYIAEKSAELKARSETPFPEHLELVDRSYFLFLTISWADINEGDEASFSFASITNHL